MARPQRFGSRFGPAVLGLGTFLAGLVIVEILIRLDVINGYVVPVPSQVAAAFERVVIEEGVLSRFLLTAGESLGAGLLVTLIGIPAGILLYRVKLLRMATETWVAALAAAPVVLVYPLFMVIFGRSVRTIIAIGTLAGLPPAILKTLEGLNAVRPVLVNVGRGYGLSGWRMFWSIMFPASIPSIFVGVRLGLIFAMINVAGVDILINFGGLGPLINELAERYDMPGTYAAICFFVVVERIEQWLRPAQ